MTRDVIILGAGFSKALYSPCPLTDELGEAVRERLPTADAAKMPRHAFRGGRFEEWLSYLSEPQPHFTAEARAEVAALAVKVTNLVREVLAEVQEAALHDGEAADWLWRFLSVLHVLRADVITFNYDNFVECGVHTMRLPSQALLAPASVCEDDILAGLPACADFPGRSVQRSEPKDYAGNPIDLGGRRSNTFRLMKLHGSLSWYWLPDAVGQGSLRRWRMPGTFGELWDPAESQRQEELPSHEPFIVPPATLKGQRLREPAIRQIWQHAAEAIAGAERIVLIGYSIPPADHSVIGMLTDGVQNRKLKFEVVNLRPQEVKARLLRLGVDPGSITTYAGKNCIKRWTTDSVAHLQREAVDRIRHLRDFDDQIILFASGACDGRFRRILSQRKGQRSIVLEMDEDPNAQNAQPVMFHDLWPRLDSDFSLEIKVGRTRFPVIGHWGRHAGSGVLMSQLHLIAAGR